MTTLIALLEHARKINEEQSTSQRYGQLLRFEI